MENRDPETNPPVDNPRAVVRPRLTFSWVWLVPIAAACVLGYVIYGRIMEQGPTITITFETGDGLSANQTQVKYKSVVLGTVDEVQLSPDMSHVTARVGMTRRSERLLTDHARFWVVRPRFDGVNAQALQSGLQTLVSGSYIAIDPGLAGGKLERSFKGLEEPPGVRSSEPGREFVLGARSLGSVGVGTPVYYRDVSVGEVLGFSLREGRFPFALRVFVRAPYDSRVGAHTRFWNVSGFRLTNDAQGFRLEMQSLRAALAGGIAFDNPSHDDTPAPQRGFSGATAPQEFALYDSHTEAEMEMHPTVASCVSYFDASLAGLSRGSDVTLLGQVIGAVTDVRLAHDPNRSKSWLSVRVAFVLQPERAVGTAAERAITEDSLPAMISNGLRAVVESKNFITGDKTLSLDIDDGKAARPIREGESFVLPSEVHDFGAIGAELSQVANGVRQIPFERIGRDLSRALRHVDETVSSPELQRSLRSLDSALLDMSQLSQKARVEVTPVLERLPQIAEQLQQASVSANAILGNGGYGRDSEFQRGATRLVEQLGEAARSIRWLAETLNRHPESILVGKSRSEDR